MARLGDVCSIRSSNHAVDKEKNWLLNLDAVEQHTGRVLEYNYVPEEGLDGSIISFDTNNVLYSKLRPNLNKVVVPEMEGYATSEMLPLYPDKKQINREFLACYLRSPSFVEWAVSKTAGAKMPRLGTKELLNKEIPLPAIDLQKKTTEALCKIDSLISLRKKQLQKLDDLVKSRFVEMFDAGSPSKCKMYIHDYADVISGFAFSSEDFCENEIPIVRISNINNGKVSLDSSICFPRDFWESNRRYRVLQGDVLMAMSGATTGKAGINTYSGPLLLNQRVACIRAKQMVSTSEFLFVATQLPWMYNLIQEASAGCAQPNISGKQIENMPIPAADYEKQKEFSVFANQIENLKLTVQPGLDKLELLKQSLMQKYFG